MAEAPRAYTAFGEADRKGESKRSLSIIGSDLRTSCNSGDVSIVYFIA